MKIIIAILLLLPSLCLATDIGLVVGADTVYGNLHSNYTEQIDFLQDEYGATVDVLADTATYNTSAYDVIVFTEEATHADVVHMADSTTPIFVVARYLYDTFKLATGQCVPFRTAPAKAERQSTTNWITKYMMDNIYNHRNNGYQTGYVGCASGVECLFDFPDWVGKDTMMCGVVDTGDSLIAAVAPERRAFVGIFRDDVNEMSNCHAWKLYGRIMAWLTYDTTLALNPWLGKICFADRDEIQSCWTEVGADDSATYSGNTRWGYDCDSILTYFKINQAAIVRMVPSDYSADSFVIRLPVDGEAINSSPVDTTYAFRVSAHEIIKSTKWRCPTCGSSGFPRDSIWVNRYDCVGGASKIQWDSRDMTSGVDFSATVLDTFLCNHETQTADSDVLHLTIPGSLFNSWEADSSDNNGMFWYPDTLYDTQDCELGTDGCYTSQYTWYAFDIKVYFSESGEPPPTDTIVTIGSGVTIGKGVKF